MNSTFITYYFETNLICILFVSFVLYSYLRDSHGLAESRWFIFTLITVQIYCIVDILAALCKNQTFTGARTILWISNTIYISIPLVLIIFWNKYITEHVRSYYNPGKVIQRLEKIIPIVSLVVCVYSFSAPLTHSTFYLDEFNGYHRAIGAYIVPAYAYLFMIYETIKMQIIRRQSTSLQIKQDASILSLFAVPCIFFSVVQVFLYGTTISQVGFTMALLIIFMGRQRNKISRDELTGLNNRREYEYMIDRLARGSGTVLIVMADIDNFKKINDTYGHLEGDNALKSVAVLLRNICSNRKEHGNIALYRYGGDEFVMVSTEANAEIMKKYLLQSIQTEFENWNKQNDTDYILNLSVGISCGAYSGKSIYKLIDSADKNMYTAKEKKQ